MYVSSRYPTRLLLRCQVCLLHVELDRGPVIATVLCPDDDIPMHIIGVAVWTPNPTGQDWPQAAKVNYRAASAA